MPHPELDGASIHPRLAIASGTYPFAHDLDAAASSDPRRIEISYLDLVAYFESLTGEQADKSLIVFLEREFPRPPHNVVPNEVNYLADKRVAVFPDKRVAIFDNVEQDLSLRQFDILSFFSRHPDFVFTRRQIIRNVWGPEYVGYLSNGTLHVHLSRLRQKLNEVDPELGHPFNGVFRAIRCVGYKAVSSLTS